MKEGVVLESGSKDTVHSLSWTYWGSNSPDECTCEKTPQGDFAVHTGTFGYSKGIDYPKNAAGEITGRATYTCADLDTAKRYDSLDKCNEMKLNPMSKQARA